MPKSWLPKLPTNFVLDNHCLAVVGLGWMNEVTIRQDERRACIEILMAMTREYTITHSHSIELLNLAEAIAREIEARA